jgi:hypothetical protein
MLIAKCGLDCAKCNAYQARLNNDQELRRKTAEQWSRDFHHDFKPEDIDCVGCQATEGVHVGYCALCEIRACALQRGLATCAACPEYGCPKLVAFHKLAPEAGKNLEALRAGA